MSTERCDLNGSILAFIYLYDEMRTNRLMDLCVAIHDIDELIRQTKSSDPCANRRVMGLSSKIELMTKYRDSLVFLKARFGHTTNQKDGKQAFVDDIIQISYEMKWIMAHGWAGSEQQMSFSRVEKDSKCDFNERVQELVMQPSDIHMFHGRRTSPRKRKINYILH